tara:strand:- start:308 stop:481 length:174 start_codon:yes stop_codon:yes gene_type:complete
MNKEQIIDLAEYYRERHNEICQEDFIIEKPDYYKGDYKPYTNIDNIVNDMLETGGKK